MARREYDPDLGRGNQHRAELSLAEDTSLSCQQSQVDYTQIGEMLTGASMQNDS